MTDLKAEHEIGFSEGKAKGKAEGHAEGLSEGEHNKACEIALKRLAKNKPLEEIVDFTGLTESEIYALKTGTTT